MTQQTTRVTVRRADRPGDLGWAVMAHGEIYHRQFGYDMAFESLVAGIVGDFATDHDPAREAIWIAEVDGVRAGCVMLIADAEPDTARLRILLVTPVARGHGIGSRLVGECLMFAREAGYRRMVLWTTDDQTAARRIYEKAGFTLSAERPEHRWGHDVIAQDWALNLT
ncbi:GNAT family N-acetyltransferase [Actinoplanes sp. NPDC051861]|uniref:GNAT family N-acetyltransferase n=1 Tax=Actinoplanes sp. NPDC051861 TaxID=3155170 RepID=UPI003420E633